MLLLWSITVLGQDTNSESVDTTFTFTAKLELLSTHVSRFHISDSIYHYPSKEDKKYIRRWKKLEFKTPDSNNFGKCEKLACAYWNMGELEKSKKIFLALYHLKDEFSEQAISYTGGNQVSTDTTIYLGYGGVRISRKNTTCEYLAKIYIEQKKFDSALYFLDLAKYKYKAIFTCGTGYYWHEQEEVSLYSMCYRGLNMHRKQIDLLLPYSLESATLPNLIFAFRQLYSQDSIEYLLENAIQNMKFTPFYDEPLCNYLNVDDKIDTLCYYSCHAFIKLLGHELFIPLPHKIEKGEKLTKERMVQELRNSPLYEGLLRKEED